MADLAISEWIKEIKQEIHATVPLLAPLHQIGKHKWAKQLTDEIRTMREAIRVLQRIGQTRGKRMGRPPNWLQATSESGASAAKLRKRQRAQEEEASG